MVFEWLPLLAFVLMTGGLLCALVVFGQQPRSPGRGDFYLSDREAEAGHIVMLAAMLLMMAAPAWAQKFSPLWPVLFFVLATFYALRLLQHLHRAHHGKAQAGLRAGSAAYHLIASLAMLYASRAHHPGHGHGMSEWAIGAGLPWPGLAVLLAAIFFIDALLTTFVLLSGRVPGSGKRVRLLWHERVAVVPHLVMDLAMVLML